MSKLQISDRWLNAIALLAVIALAICVSTGPLLWFFRSDLVVLCLLLLLLLSSVIAIGGGIYGAFRLISGIRAGRPLILTIRPLLIALAIFGVPFCLYRLATWYPELSEWRLRGLNASEVIDRLGPPRVDSREYPDSAPPGEVRLCYGRSFWWYSVRLKDDRVVEVVVSENDK